MKITRLSAYDIHEGKINSLDISLYSKFKYGHRPTSVVFAKKCLILSLIPSTMNGL